MCEVHTNLMCTTGLQHNTYIGMCREAFDHRVMGYRGFAFRPDTHALAINRMPTHWLINLAATGFKARLGSARGMRANAGTAVRLFKSAASQLGSHSTHYMGLDVQALADYAGSISKPQQITQTGAGDNNVLAFDLILRPE